MESQEAGKGKLLPTRSSGEILTELSGGLIENCPISLAPFCGHLSIMALCLTTGSTGLQHARPGFPCPGLAVPITQTQGTALGPLVLDMLKIPVSHVFLVLCFCQRFAPVSYEYRKEV